MDSHSFSSSSSTKMNNNKLSVRNKTRFKNTNLITRQKTILKKALELSVLCESETCVIHYDREGNFVEAYPEDQCQVKDILERYSRLSDQEKLKKQTNLSQFCNKKLLDEKRRSLTDAEERKKFTKKVGEFEGSLVDQFRILQDRFRDLHQDQSPFLDVMPEKNLNFPTSSSDFVLANDFSSSLIHEDPLMNSGPHDLDQQQETRSLSPFLDVMSEQNLNFPTSFSPYDLDQQQESGSLTNLLTSGDHHVSANQNHLIPPASCSTACSLNQQSKFSVFVFNHETATFTQLPSSFNHGLIGSY